VSVFEVSCAIIGDYRSDLNSGQIERRSCCKREGQPPSPVPPLTKFSRCPCALMQDTTAAQMLAGSGLPGSCPRNGDMSKSPFTHWQH
jgi:hypothetical protein